MAIPTQEQIALGIVGLTGLICLIRGVRVWLFPLLFTPLSSHLLKRGKVSWAFRIRRWSGKHPRPRNPSCNCDKG